MVSRRSVSFGIAAALGTKPFEAFAQALTPVRLLVVRKPGFSLTNQCLAPCIRGKVYDASHIDSLDLQGVILPLLGQPICDVIERPWQGNAPSVSAIPVGLYSAIVRNDPTKAWMTNINRSWRIELFGVPHRANIQFHYGSDVSWSEGCFIVGSLLQPDGSSGMEAAYCGLEGGEAAIERLRAIVEAPGVNPDDIMVGVTDDYGLYPDFSSAPTC